jgi:ArsR family transcriptional regulator, arsenate/arsenite/antimonite-responsive transcriptional repressor
MGIDPPQMIGIFRWMDTDSALAALAALAHPTRLDAFRRLIRHEPDGLPTGALVEASGLTQSTFSTHLAVLAKAGLITAEKHGRNQIQRANIDALRELMVFLAKDCCQGRAELCEPLLAELACC